MTLEPFMKPGCAPPNIAQFIEGIRYELTTLEGYACSVHNLMEAAADAHFEYTIDRWLDEYIKDGASTQEQAALWWMREHYDLVAAATRAAGDLAEVMRGRLDDLWLEIAKLISSGRHDGG